MFLKCFTSKKSVKNEKDLSIDSANELPKQQNVISQYFFSKNGDKNLQQLKRDSVLSKETVESSLSINQIQQPMSSLDYQHLGFSSPTQYLQFCRFSITNQIQVNKESAEKYILDKKIRKHRYFLQILKEVQTIMYDYDWVIEKQEKPQNMYNATKEYNQAKKNYVQSKKKLEALIQQQIQIGENNDYQEIILENIYNQQVEDWCRQIVNFESTFEKQYYQSINNKQMQIWEI